MSEESVTNDLRKAVRAHKRAKHREELAHDQLVDAMRAARDAGIKQVTLTQITGYTREHVRRLLKDD